MRCSSARSNSRNGGFHAQVKVTRETTLLFCDVEGRREPIHRKNGKFAAGKASFSREELAGGDRKIDPRIFRPTPCCGR